jgi:hypothetical protein
MNSIAIPAIFVSLALFACSNAVQDPLPDGAVGTHNFATIPNAPDAACGKIIDDEPPPGGIACCYSDSDYEIFYFDGSKTSGTCSGDAICKSGVCVVQ